MKKLGPINLLRLPTTAIKDCKKYLNVPNDKARTGKWEYLTIFTATYANKTFHSYPTNLTFVLQMTNAQSVVTFVTSHTSHANQSMGSWDFCP